MFELMPFERARNSMLNRFFDDFEKDYMTNSFSKSLYGFKTDIKDNGDSYTIEAELPGFKKEDICIDIDKDVLTVSASHSEEKEEKEKSFVRRERYSGSYSRSFDVSGVNTEEIKAQYNNGVLELTMPKVEPKEPERKRIEIG